MRCTGKLAKYAALGGFLWIAGAGCRAQSFPLRPGVWEATSTPAQATGSPIVLRYCLMDRTWPKGLNNNQKCQIARFSETASGARFSLECSMKTVQMKGPVRLTFDGKEHMTQKASLTLTFGGKTTHVTSVVDFRWKAAACTGTEINLQASSK